MPFARKETVVKPFFILASPEVGLAMQKRGVLPTHDTESIYTYLINQNIFLKNAYSLAGAEAAPDASDIASKAHDGFIDAEISDGQVKGVDVDNTGNEKYYSTNKRKQRTFPQGGSRKVNIKALTATLYKSIIEGKDIDNFNIDRGSVRNTLAYSLQKSITDGKMIVGYQPQSYPGDEKGNYVYIEFTRHNVEPNEKVRQKDLEEVKKDLYTAIWILTIREVGHVKQKSAMPAETQDSKKDDMPVKTDTELDKTKLPTYPYDLHKRMCFSLCFSRDKNPVSSFKHGHTTYDAKYVPNPKIEKYVKNVKISDEAVFNRQIRDGEYNNEMSNLLLNRYFASIARHNYNENWLRFYCELILNSGDYEILDYFIEIMRAIIMVTEPDLSELMIRLLFTRFCAKHYIHTEKDPTHPISLYTTIEKLEEPIEVSILCDEDN